jgi:hypothetical protein
MKVLELKGFKSLKALNAFHTLMLGLKMLPSYMHESYEDFFARVSEMAPEDQERLIREAVLFVELQREEVESLICFVADKNGVPYTAENMKSLKPDELIEIIVSVCREISKIKVNFVSEVEKKNSRTSLLI